MNLKELVVKKKVKEDFKTGEIINLDLNQSNLKNKIQKFEGWLIISVKKKKTLKILTIIKKINNFFIKKIIDINSPLVKSFKIINNIKKIKKSKLYKINKINKNYI